MQKVLTINNEIWELTRNVWVIEQDGLRYLHNQFENSHRHAFSLVLSEPTVADNFCNDKCAGIVGQIICDNWGFFKESISNELMNSDVQKKMREEKKIHHIRRFPVKNFRYS